MGTEGWADSWGGIRKPLGFQPAQKHSRPNPVPPLWEQQTTSASSGLLLALWPAGKPSGHLHLGLSPVQTRTTALKMTTEGSDPPSVPVSPCPSGHPGLCHQVCLCGRWWEARWAGTSPPWQSRISQDEREWVSQTTGSERQSVGEPVLAGGGGRCRQPRGHPGREDPLLPSYLLLNATVLTLRKQGAWPPRLQRPLLPVGTRLSPHPRESPGGT